MPRAIVLAVAGLILTACASRAAQSQVAGSVSSAPATAAIPWVDRPASDYVEPTPTPTAYEILDGDWSSDVCSSDLRARRMP